MTDDRRLRWLTRIVSAGCLAGMALCLHVWTADRSFPVLPLLPGLRAPSMVHEGLAIALVGSMLAAVLLSSRRWLGAACCLFACVLVALDLSRLQPWLYLYAFVLAIVACRRGPADDAAAIRTLRFLVCFVYAYSAAHKLNVSFFRDSGPHLLQPLARLLPSGWPLRPLVYLMPTVELVLAALLLIPRTRRVGIVLAAAMHAGILVLIGPLGLNYNSVVWPWNVTMVALVVVLFRPAHPGHTDDVAPEARASPLAMGARISTVVLGGILPIGGVLGFLDRYYTWGMYGGSPTIMAVWFNADVESRLPPALKREVRTLSPDQRGILILDWGMRDLNVVYPELHLMLRAAETLRPYVRRSGEATLDIVHEPDRWNGKLVRIRTPMEPR